VRGGRWDGTIMELLSDLSIGYDAGELLYFPPRFRGYGGLQVRSQWEMPRNLVDPDRVRCSSRGVLRVFSAEHRPGPTYGAPPNSGGAERGRAVRHCNGVTPWPD
jgi:hypothetical protein